LFNLADNGVSAANLQDAISQRRELNASPASDPYFMKADLIKAASAVIPNQQILVNMVSRRVRQLCLGHRPLVQVPPGTRAADIALTEIIEEKLGFESTFGKTVTPAPIVPFPGMISGKEKAA
jgi:DNA-directed RNA polymerase subunit omega